MSNTLEGPSREHELFRNAEQTPRPGNHYRQNSFRHECVPQLVSAQAAVAPHAIAVTHGKKSLTYQELDRRADRLAHYLRSLGVGPDVVVGLCIGRSIAVIVGALAILKAGAAYLPLDPSYPTQRLMFVLKDAQAPVLVTGNCTAAALPVHPEFVVVLDPEGQLPHAVSSGTSSTKPNADDLAYVIYTSGSTGQPKGVEITHDSLLNLLSWHQRAFQITPNDRASQLSALGFDAAVWEIWPYLTAGASIHLPDGVARNGPEAVP